MKARYLFIPVAILINSIEISRLTAQEPKKNEMKPYEIEPTKKGEFEKNINSIFLSMLENTEYPKDKMCVSPEIFKLTADHLKNVIINGKGFLEDYHFLSDAYKEKDLIPTYKDYDIDELAKKYDKGSFKTFKGKLAHARANHDTFIDFVFAITGKDIGQLKDDDLEGLRIAYKKQMGSGSLYNVDGVYKKLNKNCTMEAFSNFYFKSADYPSVISEFYINVDIVCECDEEGKIKLKRSNYIYLADVNGIKTDKSHIYKIPHLSKINVKSIECCPEKEEENKIALNDSNDDKGYLQGSVFVGLPLGKEADFYSLTYGAEAAYYFNLSDDFSAGVGAGYTRFTGKDYTFGSSTFKGEGTGFVPVFGTAEYDLSDKFGVRANLGYGLSTESNGTGGLHYGAGAMWNPIPGLRIGFGVSSISVEGGSFSDARITVYRTF